MKPYLQKLYQSAVDLNHRNLLDLLETNDRAVFLDLGCDEGTLTRQLATKVGTKEVHGVEIVPERIKQAEAKGIKVKNFDLNGHYDYEDSSIDVVHANQVIEHLPDTDNFLSEIFRVLKPGGYTVISTENASSWCNIFASVMGWQMFSITNFSNQKKGIGNPWALHRAEEPDLSSWNHVRILNIRGLKEYLEAFGFKIDAVRCAGYFPLPSFLGNIDRTHGHFMAFKARKPLSKA